MLPLLSGHITCWLLKPPCPFLTDYSQLPSLPSCTQKSVLGGLISSFPHQLKGGWAVCGCLGRTFGLFLKQLKHLSFLSGWGPPWMPRTVPRCWTAALLPSQTWLWQKQHFFEPLKCANMNCGWALAFLTPSPCALAAFLNSFFAPWALSQSSSHSGLLCWCSPALPWPMWRSSKCPRAGWAWQHLLSIPDPGGAANLLGQGGSGSQPDHSRSGNQHWRRIIPQP